MIGQLRGEVAEVGDGEVLVDVGGVGWRVVVGSRLAGGLEEGERVVLCISTQVREDAITLFGFRERAERDAFEQLIAMPRIGPKLALATIDHLGLNRLVEAVETENATVLAAVPGVGKKTAQRLVLELKGQLSVAFVPTVAAAPPRAAPDDMLPLALARLGYRKSEIDNALTELRARGLEQAELSARLSESLRILSGRSA